MKSLNYVLQSESADDLIGFLRSRGERAHIIAPGWVRTRALKEKDGATETQASWSEPGGAIPRDRHNIIVVAEDAVHEAEIAAPLEAARNLRVYGLFRDVFPAILCGANGMAGGLPTEDVRRYALLCVPRSGSRYLATVLSNRGVGAPREHLREPLANAIADGRLGFEAGMTALERFGQRNGVFGTKLISTFLLKASHRRMSELRANVQWMVDRGYRLFRLERPLPDTVISSYIAFLMSRWHFFGELDEASRAKLDGLAFEPSAAFDEYIRFHAEQIVVDTLARLHGIPTIPYSQIEEDIDGVVERICAAIGVDPAALEGGAARVPVPTRSKSATYVNFASNLAEVLVDRKQDILPRTVRKLRSLTGLGKAAAERLIEKAA